MRDTWDSRSFLADERSEALRETIKQHVVDVNLDLPDSPEQVHATVDLTSLGSIQVCTVRAMPTVVRRTRRQASADSEPSLFVTLQVKESSVMVQHGREAVLRPGDMAVYATTTPYTLAFGGGVHAHFLRFPLHELGLRDEVIDFVSARPLVREDPIAGLAWQFLAGLASTTLSTANASLLANPAGELLRTALTTAMPDSPLHRENLNETAALRIENFIRTHLGDPDLSAATIAAAHHISVRQLYVILTKAGIQLGEFIRILRLEQCRNDLASAHLSHLPIAAVARHRGFTNASHFSREFRDNFGLSPREWRALKLGGSPWTPMDSER
jgi:AraC-like DNA-binding protein